MKSTDIRRLKRARDLYMKIAEILERVTIDDLAPANTKTFIDMMTENAKADKAYLESLVYSANKFDMAIKQAESGTKGRQGAGYYSMNEWSNGMEDFSDAKD